MVYVIIYNGFEFDKIYQKGGVHMKKIQDVKGTYRKITTGYGHKTSVNPKSKKAVTPKSINNGKKSIRLKNATKQKDSIEGRAIKWLYRILLVVVFTGIIEYLTFYFEKDVSYILITVAFVPFVGGLVKFILDNSCEKELDASGVNRTRHPKKSDRCCEVTAMVFVYGLYKGFLRKLVRSGAYSLLVVAIIYLAIPAVSAHFQICGRIVHAISAIEYHAPEEEDSEDSFEIDDTQISLPDDYDEDVHNDSKEDYEQLEEIQDSSEGFLEDPNRFYQLENSELDQLYFYTGEFAITNWDNDDEIVETMSKFVKSLRGQKRKNLFDTNAPQFLQDEVNQASILEENMTSSAELDSVIDIRIDAWDAYPKRTFAKLLAFNHQRYALEYTAVNGCYETIEFYYAQSIFWLFESLTFEGNSEYTVKQTLSAIKMRYHDIAESAPDNSHSKNHAMALYRAFQCLENSYP